MQPYKKAAISIAFLTIMLSGGMTNGFARPDDEESSSSRSTFIQAEQILTAFENDDYDAWKKIVARKSSAYEVITKNDFDKFVAARQAVRAGDYDRAIILAQNVENNLKNKLGESYFI